MLFAVSLWSWVVPRVSGAEPSASPTPFSSTEHSSKFLSGFSSKVLLVTTTFQNSLPWTVQQGTEVSGTVWRLVLVPEGAIFCMCECPTSMAAIPLLLLPLYLSLTTVEEAGTAGAVSPVSQMRITKVQEVKQPACEKIISAQVYVTPEQSTLPFHSCPNCPQGHWDFLVCFQNFSLNTDHFQRQIFRRLFG